MTDDELANGMLAATSMRSSATKTPLSTSHPKPVASSSPNCSRARGWLKTTF